MGLGSNSSLHRTGSWSFSFLNHTMDSWRRCLIVSRIGLIAHIFSTSWFNLWPVLHFMELGLNLYLAMSSQIGIMAHIIAHLIWWAHDPPISHLTDWAGIPYFFSSRDQGSRITLFLLSLQGRLPNQIG